MYTMNDIHMHIIPGVDDGAWNHEMAHDMIHIAYCQGIDKIIATPHSMDIQDETEEMNAEFTILKGWLEKDGLPVKLYQGCEVYCSYYTMEEVIQNLNVGKIPTMNGTKYVLAEFSTGAMPGMIEYCLGKLIENQYIPIIAHVERCFELFKSENLGKLQEFKNMGCLMQVNVYSVFEEEKEHIKKAARYLMEHKMADFLGSDAHRTFHRPPCVEKGLEYLYQNYEKEYVDRIAVKNAEELLFR